MVDVLELAAFTTDPSGGNPAGVVLDADGIEPAQMLAIAAQVGFSETAFLGGADGDPVRPIRYFSPRAEVPFCGHATIATAVAVAHRTGATRLNLKTAAGPVVVEMTGASATLTSVEPRTGLLNDDDLAAVLEVLRWTADDLDPALPPRVAFAGAWHPVIAAATRARLADLDYDFGAAAELMAARDWTTLQLVHRVDATTFDSRNPFPPGGIVEDPATGAAAAAFGGYRRDLGLVDPPATVTIHQGVDLGRPSVLQVGIGPAGGIRVTGSAVPIP